MVHLSRYWLPVLIAGLGLEGGYGVGWRRADLQGQQDKPVTIAMLMMVRDEETNLRNNLPLWEGIIDYYVIGIDSKTTDGSEAAIAEILPPSTPRSVYHFDFDGFGHARSLLLSEAWRTFSNASHILISDPDWIPELKTVDKGDIDHVHDYFQFQIWDRNNLTTRQSDWLMQHREGIHMVHRLHEVLVYPVEHTITKEIPWEVYEVETPTSWHVKTGHGHSQSYRRYLFDLSLLEKDLQDEGESPSDHTLYYLGITHFALIESGIPTQIQSNEDRVEFAEEINRRVESGLHYLSQRIHLHLNSSNWEQTWAAMRWLAYSYQLFVDDFTQSEYWYQRCTAFDPERVDCPIFLARLYYDHKQHSKAWDECVKALSSTYPIRAFGNNFYIYDCFTPVEAAKTLNAIMQDEGFDGARFTLGWHLLEYASEKCDRGMLLEADDVLTTLRGHYAALAHTQGLEPEVAASCLPAGHGVEKRLLNKRLGVRVPPCSDQDDRFQGPPVPGVGHPLGEGVGREGKKTYGGAGYAIGPRHWQSPTWQDHDDHHQRQRRRGVSGQESAGTSPPSPPAPPAEVVPHPVRGSLGTDKGQEGSEPWWQAAWRQLPSSHTHRARGAQRNTSQGAGDRPGVLDRGGSGASQESAAVGWASATVHGQQEGSSVPHGPAKPQPGALEDHRGMWESEDRVKDWRPAAWQWQRQPLSSPPSAPAAPSAHAATPPPGAGSYEKASMEAVQPSRTDQGVHCPEAPLVARLAAQQAAEATAWAITSIKRTGVQADTL